MSNEPVAWMVYTLDGKSVCVTDNPADFTGQHKVLPLYTNPTPDDTALPRKVLNDVQLPQGYKPHELPADYTGKVWIEGQLREFAEMVATAEREPIGLTFAEVKDIIQSNITITDPKLFDAVYAVAVDIELAVLEKNAAGRANNDPR
jgi:hypothetical protein